jgi:hypothetical protein
MKAIIEVKLNRKGFDPKADNTSDELSERVGKLLGRGHAYPYFGLYADEGFAMGVGDESMTDNVEAGIIENEYATLRIVADE